MDHKSFFEIKSNLVSLGFAYLGEPSKLDPDPEQTILEIIHLFTEDQKLYQILLAWLETYGDLVHVERIASQIGLIPMHDQLVLGATALKCVNAGDSRFKVIVEKIKKLKPKATFPFSGDDSYLIEKNGIDLEFKFFGVSTSKISPSLQKKIIPREAVLKENLWLRLRALLGSNFRADLTYIKLMRLAQNPYGAMKLLKCSKETSYRIWSSLVEADVESLIQFRKRIA